MNFLCLLFLQIDRWRLSVIHPLRVDSESIVWLTIGPQPMVTTTLISFMEEHLKFNYKKIVADAGYESEENYLFLEVNEQLSFPKPGEQENICSS